MKTKNNNVAGWGLERKINNKMMQGEGFREKNKNMGGGLAKFSIPLPTGSEGMTSKVMRKFLS